MVVALMAEGNLRTKIVGCSRLLGIQREMSGLFCGNDVGVTVVLLLNEWEKNRRSSPSHRGRDVFKQCRLNLEGSLRERGRPVGDLGSARKKVA